MVIWETAVDQDITVVLLCRSNLWTGHWTHHKNGTGTLIAWYHDNSISNQFYLPYCEICVRGYNNCDMQPYLNLWKKQCCGSMTFWGGSGSGSADPCLWLMDPDPDPAIFVIDLQDASKKLIFHTIFSAYYFLKLHLHHYSKIKSQKESQNSRNQGFSFYFCMMIEGSGSRRPKNMWLRIRIRNTGKKVLLPLW